MLPSRWRKADDWEHTFTDSLRSNPLLPVHTSAGRFGVHEWLYDRSFLTCQYKENPSRWVFWHWFRNNSCFQHFCRCGLGLTGSMSCHVWLLIALQWSFTGVAHKYCDVWELAWVGHTHQLKSSVYAIKLWTAQVTCNPNWTVKSASVSAKHDRR